MQDGHINIPKKVHCKNTVLHTCTTGLLARLDVPSFVAGTVSELVSCPWPHPWSTEVLCLKGVACVETLTGPPVECLLLLVLPELWCLTD